MNPGIHYWSHPQCLAFSTISLIAHLFWNILLPRLFKLNSSFHLLKFYTIISRPFIAINIKFYYSVKCGHIELKYFIKFEGSIFSQKWVKMSFLVSRSYHANNKFFVKNKGFSMLFGLYFTRKPVFIRLGNWQPGQFSTQKCQKIAIFILFRYIFRKLQIS